MRYQLQMLALSSDHYLLIVIETRKCSNLIHTHPHANNREGVGGAKNGPSWNVVIIFWLRMQFITYLIFNFNIDIKNGC